VIPLASSRAGLSVRRISFLDSHRDIGALFCHQQSVLERKKPLSTAF
jgi:hypothetical protein